MRRFAYVLVLVSALVWPAASAQTKQPPARSDWGRFEQLSVARNALSPDGQWLAYAINRSSRDNDLRIKNIASGTEEVVAFGTQPTFTADSKWIVYAIGYSEAQEERMRTQRRPVQRKLGLLRLDGTSKPVIIDGIESFNVDPSGSFVAMRRYAPVPAAGGRCRAAACARRACCDAAGCRRR